MVPNGIREAWAAGRPVINGWLSIGSPFTAEIMAAAGYDALTVDMQHGALDYADLLPMLQALRGTAVTPMARVPWLAPGDLMKALDAGAYGVICPMVNNRADAELLASYVRYPPVGERSFGPTRVNFALGSDYGAHANEEVICLAMIETAEAYANTEAIVSTPGIDGVYIGPADLTLGLTGRKYRTGFDREEPELVGLYLIGPDGTPHRLGFAIGNEFSDHVTERQNYLYLAHSKLRACAVGPELRVGELPQDLRGTSRIRRGDGVLWEKPFLTGEANMCHALANLEYHHFKYAAHRRPGDVHLHFFGTATLSFADEVRVQPGDVFEIDLPALGAPLRNPLRSAAAGFALHGVRPL